MRHLGRAAGDLLGHGLRRGDDEELGLRQQLGERHRDVAGARRQVDEQEVQLAPLDVLEELGERLVEHRPAPDDGAVLLDEEADRHDLHAVALQRHDLALRRDGRAARDAEHARDRVAPDVGVEDAHALAVGGQRGGQVGGDRRLADAALARADADDVGDLGQRALGQPAGAAELLLQRRPSPGRRGRRRRPRRAATPASAPTAVRDGGLEVAADRAAGRGQRDRDAHERRRPLSIERTISSSTIERRSSGSMTASRALRISSREGMASIQAEGVRPARDGRNGPPMAGRFEGGEVLLCRRGM